MLVQYVPLDWFSVGEVSYLMAELLCGVGPLGGPTHLSKDSHVCHGFASQMTEARGERGRALYTESRITLLGFWIKDSLRNSY